MFSFTPLWERFFRRLLLSVGFLVFSWLGTVADGGGTPIGEADVTPAIGDSAAVAARIAELRQEVARHDDLYFRQATPAISDFEYDLLKAKLLRLEALFPEAAEKAVAIGPVGDDRMDGFTRFRHVVPMLSLDKAMSLEDLAAFHRRMVRELGKEEVFYQVEPKFDGVAVSLIYEMGHLVRAVTRGNGVEGDEITANLRATGVLPERLRSDLGAVIPERVELRGEVFMSFLEFDRIQRERSAAGEEGFANPRNLAAGTVKLTDPAEAGERRLELVVFGWGEWLPEAECPPDLDSFQRKLQKWGLLGVSEIREARGWHELQAAVSEVERSRNELGFPIDGAVVKVASVAEQDLLGLGTTAPKWAIAVKFPPKRAMTRLLGITLQVGRSGVLTPVAELEPVLLSGTTVSRATLHNAAEIERLDLRIGDFVQVEKAGEIIPAIVGVDVEQRRDGSERFAWPSHCPVCGGNLLREEGQAAILCVNEECPARIARWVEHFASALGIRGLGPSTAGILVEGGLRSPGDLYARNWEGIGGRRGEQLQAAVEESRNADWEQVVWGIGIPGVGQRRAEGVAQVLPNPRSLREAKAEDFVRAGLGATGAADAVKFLKKSIAREMLVKLERAGFGGEGVEGEKDSGSGSARGRFHDEIVVFTGKLERWTRKEAAEKLEAEGARVGGSVTRKTTLLVVGDGAGAKLGRARKLGVSVIDEVELVRRLGEEIDPL